MDLVSNVLFEDNHLLAVNKPAGILVQGDQTGDPSLVDFAKEYLRVKYNKPGQAYLGLIHRLDRPVSGVVLLAKTSKALSRMNLVFQQRQVKKYYWALTENRPPQESDSLVHWLTKNTRDNRAKAHKREVPQAKRSELEYSLKMMMEKKYLLEVLPITGRPHQIRVQLSTIGCPILGDAKYGYKGPASRIIALHAKSLHFNHPVKKEPLVIEAPLYMDEIWKPFNSN
ncbi:MAG: RNA pseudouridine synthase [Cyclobacteriaceae bacterium]|nr:MAG: RNA pseudouridine synthase [Cyclobacteriaceae bacterium]